MLACTNEPFNANGCWQAIEKPFSHAERTSVKGSIVFFSNRSNTGPRPLPAETECLPAVFAPCGAVTLDGLFRPQHGDPEIAQQLGGFIQRQPHHPRVAALQA